MMKSWLDSLAHHAQPNIDECIAQLGPHIDWLNQLHLVPQDPEWHGEGNVYIHTGMVLQQLYQLLNNEAKHLTGWRRQALILGALLHDVGKTQRTKEVEIQGVMRIACPQHEAVGRSYLAFKLMALELPFQVVWTVLGLVGEHHMPKLLVVKNQNKSDYYALSRRANLELLYWMEVADMRGRICPDLAKQLMYLEEFRMFAEDYAVWQDAFYPAQLAAMISLESDSAKRYVMAYALTDLEKGNITTLEEAIARTYAHKEKYAHLVVLCGPSGIGKSNFVSKHYPDYHLVSLDELRTEINKDRTSQKNRGQVMQRAKERLKICLRRKDNVVWDATNLRSDFRKIICDLGRDYHALTTLVVLLAPESDVYRGNAQRQFAVSTEILTKQLESYQFPLVNESHEYIVANQQSEVLWRSASMPALKALHYD